MHRMRSGRAVPVAYPVSADWSATRVFIGPAEDARGPHVAAYDPLSGEVTALRAGTGELSVTVNGSTTAVPVTVTD